ncbi:stage V sporulation protein AA [Fictibacillus halophilus]|uniref:Stage V sporulation protein AA n=1 Tax=Fictibacillus halophilus TaxID=1610490 RepID=A0ABV2LH74_9BACL|nr:MULTISPECIES: stage V sporulation protein AA [Fictibacillus]MBH0157527.1 stage V sporulation protein AA [Fictibacillus sp. 5RED26]MBH0166532.1 stage V sporulation protein AA [Fictibacillus sp. 7GRE50]MBH0174458.1 stage V sporulation protein AA [Fictibacillus sp. 23RED33]
MDKTVYLRMRQRVQVIQHQKVTIGEVAQIVASDELEEAIKGYIIHEVTPEDKHLIVIDVMRVIATIQKKNPGLDVQTIGPAQSILEIQMQQKKLAPVYFVLVWLLLFTGSALAIMNFHEDVSMQLVHQKIYFMITGHYKEQPLLLQIPYSFGLGLGMILFFNHLFRKRLNEEPSPLEVEMFNYQQDLDQYVIVHENKETEKKINGN